MHTWDGESITWQFSAFVGSAQILLMYVTIEHLYVCLGTPLGHCGSLPAKAKAKVPDKELKDVAKEIAGCWLDLATELDPSLFQVKKKLLEIQGDHRYPSQTAKAQCMLETWRGHYGENATCTRLVNALCRTDIRSVATEVFGQELVNFICLQSQSQ